MDAQLKPLQSSTCRYVIESNSSSWRTSKGKIANYPRGVRNIKFLHGGIAARMTGAKVTVAFPKSSGEYLRGVFHVEESSIES